MESMVKSFEELTSELQSLAGGKGGMLAKMYQADYPVPEGFVVLATAFKKNKLDNRAWEKIKTYLNGIRKNNKSACFAVRSSALSEDSASASFAGEFETVLNVKTDEDIKDAIYKVFKSKDSERVKSYSEEKGMEKSQQIAIVIQLMIQPEISGVLFTADPVTGSHRNMVGNYVHGLGEQLVSGENNADEFKLEKPKGVYNGPAELKRYASKLYQYAERLEKEQGIPQDIEWSIADGKLYILQARPITTLSMGNLDTYQINYSLTGDELWTNTNVAEAIPDVYPPFTWSIAQQLDEAVKFIPDYYIFSGNISGKPYMNISRRISVISTVLGKDPEDALKVIGDLYGEIPEEIDIPVYPYTRFEVIKFMLPVLVRTVISTLKLYIKLPGFLKKTPDWCSDMRKRILNVESKEELLSIWREKLQPYLFEALNAATVAALNLTSIANLDQKLTESVGTEDANTLLSNLRGESGLASLGPVAGISKVIKGEMSRKEYLNKYGHRGPHEYELSIADPREEPDWLEKQIEEYKKSDIDVDKIMDKQHVQYQAAKRRFKGRFPGKSRWLERKLKKAAEAASRREKGRSEFVRVFRLVRTFALRAAEMTGIGDDVFFYYIDEIEELLAGKDLEGKFVLARKENYERYKELLSGIEGLEFLKPQDGIDYNYAYFPVFLDSQKFGCSRDELYEHLKSYNYYSRRYFYPLISSFNMYKSLPSASADHLPTATRIADQVICLPIYPDLDMGHVENIARIIREKRIA